MDTKVFLIVLQDLKFNMYYILFPVSYSISFYHNCLSIKRHGKVLHVI